ncbi:MAG: hypothetical protein K5851_01805 [Lachnospiraceae bacterium]|nr:hypothetical protein [Lachnospiraceae bacterium]
MGVLNFLEHSKKRSKSLVQPDDKPFENKEEKDIFVRSIGDHYVANLELDLSDKELEKMSITDGAEMWRLFVMFRNKMSMKDPSILEEDDRRLDRLADALIEKVFKAKELYCIYSKSTGEPYLFSDTIKLDEGYICTPPDIRFITPAYKGIMEKLYPDDIFELRRIDNVHNSGEIEKFISHCIYVNGACGFELNSEFAAIDSEFVEIDKSLAVNEGDVVNPNLMRWMIVMSQIDSIKTEDERLIYNLCFGFFSREIQKAEFLVPVKETDDEKIFGYAIEPGKFDRKAVQMYTDMDRFNEKYRGWKYRKAKLGDVIVEHDVIINDASHPRLGFYIGEQVYKDIQDRIETSEKVGLT